MYQQLAGRAAAAIHGRLIAALGGEVLPEPLLALSDEAMRAVGLSRNKMASLRDLAVKVLDGTVVLSPRGPASAAGRPRTCTRRMFYIPGEPADPEH